MKSETYDYAFDDTVSSDIKEMLISVPGRWGRMPPLSRAVVVEAGKLLRQHNLLAGGANQAAAGRIIGLIGGSRWGSNVTDQHFYSTMKEEAALASPALFGYTLANIPLAEAANQFGLTGPVYAIIDSETPLQSACNVAKRLLRANNKLDMMLACEFDSTYGVNRAEQLSVTFTIVKLS